MYSDRTGTDKNHPGQNLPGKRPPDKTPGQKPPRTIETEFVQGGFCPGFCTRPSRNLGEGGTEMCDVLSGGPGMCDEVLQGGKNWPKIA